MNTGASKRVFGVLVVLLLAATLMVGAGSADTPVNVAKVGETEYPSLQEAISAVSDTEYTVTLLGNTAGDGAVIDKKKIIIDLAGYTYTFDGTLVGSSGTETNGLQILKGSDGAIPEWNDVTIKNGMLVMPESKTNGKMIIQNYANLTLIDVTLNASKANCDYALSVNCGNVELTDKTAIQASANKVAMDASYWPSMYALGTQINIDTTGTIEGNIEVGFWGKSGVEFPTPSKSVLTINNINHIGEVTVSEDATGLSAEEIATMAKENVRIFGGSFSEDPTAYVVEGYTVLESEGMYTVQLLPPAAEIGNVKYSTLVEAFAAVQSNEKTTIKLLRNVEEAGIFVAADRNLNVVLDLGGYKYTCIGPAVGSDGTKTQAFHLEKGNTITIMNGVITSTDVTVSNVKMLIQNYCDLTIHNVKLDGANIGDGQYTASNNCGNIVYSGTTEIIAPPYGKAFDVYYWSAAYPTGVSVTIADSTVKIDGAVEFMCDLEPSSSDDHLEKATLLVPVGYEVESLNVCSNHLFQEYTWGASNVPGMTKLVKVDVVSPWAPAHAGVTTDDTGKTTINPTGDDNVEVEGDNTAVVDIPGGVTLRVTFDDPITPGTSVSGTVAEVKASYDEATNVAVPALSEIDSPSTISIALNITLGKVTELPRVSTTFDVTLASEVTKEHAGYFPVAMLTGESNTVVNTNITEDGIEIIFTVPKAWVDSMGGKDGGRIFFFHITDAGIGDPQNVAVENIVDDETGNYYKIKVYGNTFSTYALAGALTSTPITPPTTDPVTPPVNPPVQPSSGSSSSGSSTWLPSEPTETPTEQPTDKPTDTVPTDIPSTQPTATPSTPGFGVLAVLAGLGAVAALRRQ